MILNKKTIRFHTVNTVIKIHDKLIVEFGGLVGIRDMHLLSSAVETPKAMMFGNYLHESIYDKAAAYLFHIVQNHAFYDANKRTGAFSAYYFLVNNDVKTTFNDDDYRDLVVLVAQGKKTKEEIALFFKKHSE